MADFWFHVVRNGVDSLYKCQMKSGPQMLLKEQTGHTVRSLTFVPHS